MVKATLIELFERDLLKVKEELRLYEKESAIWEIYPGIHNAAGNLALHLVGNLQHFIGATLGHSGYVRRRDDEFSLKNVPVNQLLAMLDDTVAVVKAALAPLTTEDLEADFPLEKHGATVSVTYMLLHLLTHLDYHLGQINYHRRLIPG